MRRDRIGLQLFTVRDLLAADLPGALRAVADAGFRAVELARLAHVPPAELARALDEAGLTVIASHEPIELLRADPVAVADRLRAVGCDLAIVPALPEKDRATIADVRRAAADLRRLVPRLAERGVRLGYHNHDDEFAALEGTTAWDVLLAELPPEVVVELDVFWVAVGGRDPIDELGRLGDRAQLVHLKDRLPGIVPRDAPPGEGDLPLEAIVEAARAAGVEWYIAEMVDAADPLAATATAARYLERLAV